MRHTHTGKNNGDIDEQFPAVTVTARTVDALQIRQRILVADDDSATVSLLQSALCQWYDVDSACDGVEALEKLRTDTYSLVIADIVMP